MREATIEECAKICDRHAQWAEDKIEDDSTRCQVFATTSNAANDCAALIRDRLSTSATLSKSAPEET